MSWRYARGIISTDDALLARWDAPELDRVVLDPVREEDAGERTSARAQSDPHCRSDVILLGYTVFICGSLTCKSSSSVVTLTRKENICESEARIRLTPPIVLRDVPL